jgi:sugar/nucleoside kinase (ribokinase family)
MSRLATLLRQADLSRLPVVAGFDGFVDELVSVRGEDGRPLASLADLGTWISGCAGRNGLRRATGTRTPGGCAVNLGDAAAALGMPVDFFGTVGAPHPAFADFARRCRSFTPWGDFHGCTTAYECRDGKAMIAQVDQLAGFDTALLAHALADGAYARACAGAAVVAMTNWSLYPGMTACWELLARDVFARLGRRVPVLIDLVDPSGRPAADVRAMLAALQTLHRHADVGLAVNLGECAYLCNLLGLAPPQPGAALADAAGRLRAALGLARVVAHHRDGDAEADATGAVFSPPAPRCLAPMRSTGAGDRFNAGWIAGFALGLAPADRLALGAATAGTFVRLGASPDRPAVAAALEVRP